ncbi:hypothetical protein AKJ16_DCAP09849 [Drosera capensis]
MNNRGCSAIPDSERSSDSTVTIVQVRGRSFDSENLDVVHIEKNVFDNVANTVMDVIGKRKDNVSARRDLKMYCNRRSLNLKEEKCGATTKLIMPKALYVLTKEERVVVCSWIRQLRFPHGYASDLI